MVCSRDESLTQRINQMKLFNAIAVAAVIGASFIASNPAEAFSSRCKPDGFGGQVCITGAGEHQQYNNNPARSSNYRKAIDDDRD